MYITLSLSIYIYIHIHIYIYTQILICWFALFAILLPAMLDRVT